MDELDPRFIRSSEPEAGPAEKGETVDLGDDEAEKSKPDSIIIETGDGSVTINFGGLNSVTPEDESSDHDANLALYLGEGILGGISEELLRAIGDDITRQEQRLADTVKAIDLLGVKLEDPRSEPNEEGISVVKHPILLEAVLRFQAQARGELLPSDGPVKVANEGDGTRELDSQANQLENDFNYYLTTGAPEYYPDFDRMLFTLGLNGEAYRKVYYHPLKRRPVCETIDRKDIILSEGAVSLEACARVTHRSRMRPSVVKQMQLAGVWRDVSLTMGAINMDLNVVNRKLEEIMGVQPKAAITNLEDNDREIYECYCDIDLQGYEHKEEGEATGLPLPYRVTLDRESRQILEIRRWWEEGDESYVRKEVFCEYVFVPAFPGVNFGLLHLIGNSARALTAGWRMALDAAMLANFPGGIMARSTGKQQTTNIRVGPGQVAPMDVDGVPLNQAFMPLPYKDVTAGLFNIIQNVQETAQRVGGTADTAIGEGRNDAPVGTTIALIEQAQKVMSAVHKRLHAAQAKEFLLLKELFRRDPESIWRSNKNPKFAKDRMQLLQALDNSDIVPKADPNTASHTMRVQKAIAIYTLAQQNPSAFDQKAVYAKIFDMIGIDDAEALFSKAPPGPPPVDETKKMAAQAALVSAQAKVLDASVKAQAAQAESGIKMADVQAKNMEHITKQQTVKAKTMVDAADIASKMKLEQMRLKQSEVVHGDKTNQTNRHKENELMSSMLHKGLDLEAARRKNEMDLAHKQQQAAADRLHEVALENQRQKAAEQAQFMSSEE